MSTPLYTLEICVGDLQSARAAAQGGAARVELCAALSEGGVTPSAGLFREVRRIANLQVHVLIRPRGGDFLYDEAEIRLMEDDIRLVRDWGADGVVVGALTREGRIDERACARFIDAAQGIHVTFHRAFDLCCEPFAALETLVGLGFDRLLTSGQAQTAEAGIPLLSELVVRAADRLVIMPGSGVTAANAQRILRETGATELHASARTTVQSAMQYRRGGVSMGAAGTDEFVRKETDAAEVSAILRAMHA